MSGRKVTSLALSAGSVVAMLVTLALAERVGRSSRVGGDGSPVGIGRAPTVLVAGTPEALQALRQRHVRGRILVHLGKFLHFIEPDGADASRPLASFPFGQLATWEARVSHRDFLWVAMRANLTREIYNVLPGEVFREKAGAVGNETPPEQIEVRDRGFRRTVLQRIPAIEEPVLVVIDASLFDSPDSDRLLRDLEASGLRSDLLLLNLAGDNPGVTRGARLRLRAWAAT